MTSGDGGHLECGLAPRTNSMPGGNLHAVEKSALKPERPTRVHTINCCSYNSQLHAWTNFAVQTARCAVSHSSPGVRQ